ncbi:MAG: hypothetical protein Q8878_04790 [Bacillota bacterium]|nr:hypothetical protein [Bacillota bacterium]
MKSMHRFLAGILAALTLTPVLSTAASAGEPAAAADEAVYVNLDYYGKMNQVNIVKGYSLNGSGKITDYGAYSKVTNMTDETAPSINGNSVSWNLPQKNGRFYFECAPKSGTVSLPWSFDVSYKLNGVPTDAKKLAGAKGMVEIDIKALPNKNAPEYLKNNMLLQVGTAVKMKDTLSLEAPGAELQSLGDYKAALFAGVPGEEKTYTIRIGTENFETMGVFMLMVPGTLSQFKDIKDIKDAKDTVKDSLDSINSSTNQLLGTIESMSGGLSQVQSGLNSLDGARGTMSAAKDGLFSSSEKSLADLQAVAEETGELVPHLQNAQITIGEFNNDLNEIVKTVDKSEKCLDSIDSSLSSVYDDVKDLRSSLDDLSVKSADRDKLMNKLNTDNVSANAILTQLKSLLTSMYASNADMSTELSNLLPTLKYLANLGDNNAKLFLQLFPKLKSMIDSSDSLLYGLNSVCGEASGYLDTLKQTIGLLNSYLGEIDGSVRITSSMLTELNRINDSAQTLLELGDDLIDDIDVLDGTMNKFNGDAVEALKDAETLLTGIKNALTSSHAFLSAFEAALKKSSGSLDEGTKKSLEGLIGVLGKSIDGIGCTSSIRDANNTIKKTIDDKIDKYENDNNLLDMDSDASPVSFTSAKNPAPESIQVVLRTEEIKVDDKKDDVKDAETPGRSVSAFERLKNIFVELFKSIASLFSN